MTQPTTQDPTPTNTPLPGTMPSPRPAEDVAISVTNLGKAYRLYKRPQDRLKHHLFWRFGKEYGQAFWALRGVNFEVNRGEAVGVIGRNGSGKSTLLQMLAGTLRPSEGHITINGRVSALLELGSGFNPEYTGRQNVFHNGAILGISNAEMQRRFDQIASFADIGQFMDQPVKTYSSGMFARLAFSVAVAVDPDILIVDEILAVGDYAFQQKCATRMRQMRDRGLTLFYVSHGPDAIKSICSRALFLIEGKPAYWGSAEQAVDLYFNYLRQQTNKEAMQLQSDIAKPVEVKNALPGQMRYGTGHVQIERTELTDATGQPCRAFRFGDDITLNVYIRAFIHTAHLSVSYLVRDLTGIDLTGTTTFDEHIELPAMPKDSHAKVSIRFRNVLRPGNYGFSVAINRVSLRDYSDNVLFDQIDGCACFVSVPDPARPIHYKFHTPVEVQFNML